MEVLTNLVWKVFLMQEYCWVSMNFINVYSDSSNTNKGNAKEELIAEEDNNSTDDTDIDQNTTVYHS